MSFETEVAAFRSYFRPLWQADYPAIPIFFPNLGEPTGDPKPDGPWIQFWIQNGQTFAVCSGPNPPENNEGQIVIELFDKLGTDEGLLRRRADSIASYWRAFSSPGYYLRETSLQVVGRSSRDPAYYQMNTLTPYEREELP